MPQIPSLDLHFTPEAKARVLAFLASITDYPPTLTLMKSSTDRDPELRWGYGAYGPPNLEHVGPELERLGHSLLYLVDGLTVAIPQFHLLEDLRGKTLGLGDRGLVLMERASGI